MKTILFTILSAFVTTICYAQITIADSGKYEFKQQAKKENPDYSKAYRILTSQVNLNPNNAELRYFLGYTIDRLNADDGKQMYQLKKEMTIKASEQFEKVNKLEPIYKGEYFILDPYTKISSIWGSLAESYLNRKLNDSATWAFNEGKKRGGFIEPVLEYNRQLLNSCSKNAILVTFGDNITIPIWYLQTVENLRKDITVIDANLINTIWYPKYLKDERNLQLSYNNADIDTIEYIRWNTKDIVITNPEDTTQKVSWELKPTYINHYILKGDRILLDVIQQNYFKRAIYFSSNSDNSYNLFLDSNLLYKGLVDKVSFEKSDYQNNEILSSNNLKSYSIQKLKSNEIEKSKDAIVLLNGFRWAYYTIIEKLISQEKYSEAKQLVVEMKQKFNKEKLPFITERQEKYFEDLFILIK